MKFNLNTLFLISISTNFLRLSELHQDRIKIIDSSLNFDQVESQVTETLSNFLDEE